MTEVTNSMPEIEEDEDMIDTQPWLAYCWAVAFAVMCACVLAMVITICVLFRRRSRHRSYLLFFAFTSCGILLLFLDRTTEAFGTMIIKDEWANWIWYIFGQSLTVCGEVVRAGRLIIICYGYPSIRGWVHPGSVNVRYLTTGFMSVIVLVLNIPVLIMYLVLTFTQSETADYVAVAYYCFLIAVVMMFTFKLWQKRSQLKQHQLSETKTLVIYGAALSFYVIFDNVRYYGFPDEMYGDNAEVWETIDFVSFCLLAAVVLFIWARNVWIMWERELNNSQRTTNIADSDAPVDEEAVARQNKWRRGRINKGTIDEDRYDSGLVPGPSDVEGNKSTADVKDIDELVKGFIDARMRKESLAHEGEEDYSNEDDSGGELALNDTDDKRAMGKSSQGLMTDGSSVGVPDGSSAPRRKSLGSLSLGSKKFTTSSSALRLPGDNGNVLFVRSGSERSSKSSKSDKGETKGKEDYDKSEKEPSDK